MKLCGATIKLASDIGNEVCTVKCGAESHSIEESHHVATIKTVHGHYSIAWGFDEDAPWWEDDVPLWGRHPDGTPKTQDEFKVNKKLAEMSPLDKCLDLLDAYYSELDEEKSLEINALLLYFKAELTAAELECVDYREAEIVNELPLKHEENTSDGPEENQEPTNDKETVG